MATGDITLFEEYILAVGDGEHDLSADTLLFGIVDNTLVPVKSIASPTWADYSANEVGVGGNYTANGETLTTVTWTEADGVGTLAADSFTLAQNGAGFTDAYWGIIYNGTSTGDQAIAFMELGGPVSEVAGAVTVKFNGAAVGAPGTILTHSD